MDGFEGDGCGPNDVARGRLNCCRKGDGGKLTLYEIGGGVLFRKGCGGNGGGDLWIGGLRLSWSRELVELLRGTPFVSIWS